MQAAHNYIDLYINSLWLERGLSDNTQASYQRDLKKLEVHLLQAKASLITATSIEIMTFLADSSLAGIKSNSLARSLSSIKGFYQYLLRENHIAENPAALIDAPKRGRSIPKSLSETDVEALLQAPKTNT
ncbi:MAG: site-specific integrase, partial [Oceanospirillaceae bacterium]|nr:site-specific integrase [Oceanospirillaceae bacterium]